MSNTILSGDFFLKIYKDSHFNRNYADTLSIDMSCLRRDLKTIY